MATLDFGWFIGFFALFPVFCGALPKSGCGGLGDIRAAVCSLGVLRATQRFKKGSLWLLTDVFRVQRHQGVPVLLGQAGVVTKANPHSVDLHVLGFSACTRRYPQVLAEPLIWLVLAKTSKL